MMKLTKYGLRFSTVKDAQLASDALKDMTRINVKRSQNGLFFTNAMSRDKAYKMLMNDFLFERI